MSRDDFPLWDRDEDLIAAVSDPNDGTGYGRRRVVRCAQVEVVIGRGGAVDVELDVDAIRADGVPLYRRRGGGCAVVLDPGNLVVSAAASMAGVGGVTTAFTRFTDWLIGGLADAGCPGVTSDGVSDLVLDDRKVGGSCIWRTRGLVYYSTTLLIDPDLDRMARYLPHPPREPDYRRGRDHAAFLGRLPVLEIDGFTRRLAASLAEPPRFA